MIEEEEKTGGKKAENQQLLPKTQRIEYIEGTNIDKNLKLFKGDAAIEGAGCCSRFFFSWARPFLRVSENFH